MKLSPNKMGIHLATYSKNSYWKFLGPEDKIHAECVDFLSATDLIWAHPPNEGKRTPFEQFKAKVLGITSGLMDFLIFEPHAGYCGLFIEIKAGKNTQSPSQLEMAAKLSAKGYRCTVCYSKDEFVKAVEDYLKINLHN